MSTITELKNLYDEYDKMIQDLTNSTSPLARAFNLGLNSRNHPCNQAFYDNVGKWVKDFLATSPSQQEVYEATAHILTAATRYQNEDSCAYMQAAQGHVADLIPLLCAQDRAELRDWYDNRYPKKVRLPIQDKIYKLLRK